MSGAEARRHTYTTQDHVRYGLEIATAGIAAALWYLWPQASFWPLLLALLPWLARALESRRPIRPTGYELPIVLFLITAAAAVWSAYDLTSALAKFWLVVGSIVLFYAFAQHPGHQQWSMLLLGGLGAALTVYFLATHDWDQYDYKLPLLVSLGKALQAPLPALPGHRLHPNVVGGILALLLPFAIGATVVLKGTLRWTAGAAGLVIAFGLLMSRSRGAWLAVLVAAVVALGWQLLGRGLSGDLRRQIVAVGGAMLLLWLGLLLILMPERIVALPQTLVGDAGRVRLAHEGLVLALDYPLIGAGLSSFQMLHATYAMLIHVGFSVHAHNLLLDIAIEQGLVGVLALIGLLAAAAVRLYKMAATAVPVAPAAGTLALITVLVHGLFDDALYGSRGLLLLFVPLAFIVPQLHRRRSRQRAAEGDSHQQAPGRQAWQIAAISAAVLIVVMSFSFQRPLRAILAANLAAIAQSKAELSVYSWPEWPIQDALRRTLDLSAVRAGYGQSLRLAPRLPSANRRLGQLLLSLGQYEQARDLLATAYAVRPWDTATRQLYGEALIVTGDEVAGAALWDGLDMSHGQLMGRTYWYGSIGDAARQAAVETVGR